MYDQSIKFTITFVIVLISLMQLDSLRPVLHVDYVKGLLQRRVSYECDSVM